MKRLNPKTGKPFKKGEIREDGFVFYQYKKQIKPWTKGYYEELWLKQEIFKKHNFTNRSGSERTIKNVALNLLKSAQGRCRGCPSRTASGRLPTNGKVTITKKWILDRIEKGICEATGEKLTIEPRKANTVSLDRIDSNNPDYTPENCRIVTWQFNNMRGAYSDEEFIRVAKQLEKTKKRKPTPVSTGSYLGSEIYPELGASITTGSRQDDNNPNHHCGTIQRQDVDHRTQANSGDSVGHRGEKVGASSTFEGVEIDWEPIEEAIRAKLGRRHLSDKP